MGLEQDQFRRMILGNDKRQSAEDRNESESMQEEFETCLPKNSVCKKMLLY